MPDLSLIGLIVAAIIVLAVVALIWNAGQRCHVCPKELPPHLCLTPQATFASHVRSSFHFFALFNTE